MVTKREHELDLAAAEHHRKAAHHFTIAAHEHTKAAEADSHDDHVGAAPHAHLAYGHQIEGIRHAEIAAVDEEQADPEDEDHGHAAHTHAAH